MDLDLGACKECRAAEREAVMLERQRLLEETKRVVVEARQKRRLLEARLRRQLLCLRHGGRNC